MVVMRLNLAGPAPLQKLICARPDVAFANNDDNTLSVCQNVVPFGGPPVITSQPTNQMVATGNTAAFTVTAAGSIPLIYQWSFNRTNIDGATNTSLTLSSSFHAHQFLLAQPGGAMVRRNYAETDSTRQLQECQRPNRGNPGIYRSQQPKP
jgi:hypothetical protein